MLEVRACAITSIRDISTTKCLVSDERCEDVKRVVEEFMKERGLKLSEEKTATTNINDGFDFLGWNFRKFKGKLLIQPSTKEENHEKA